MCEGSKLIRKRKDGKDYKYQCWEERGADVISDHKCACEKLSPPHTARRAASAGSSKIVGMI